MKPERDNSDIPNPDPKTFHGNWTDWSEEHDQKSLKKKATYVLRHKGVVPDEGKPFYVQITHPFDGQEPLLVLGTEKARRFNGAYLLSTCWNWERTNEAEKV